MPITHKLSAELSASPDTFYRSVREEIDKWRLTNVKFSMATETRPAGVWFSGTEDVSVLLVSDGIHRAQVFAERVGQGFCFYTRCQWQKAEMLEKAKRVQFKISEEARYWRFCQIIERVALGVFDRLQESRGGVSSSPETQALKPLEVLTPRPDEKREPPARSPWSRLKPLKPVPQKPPDPSSESSHGR